MKASARVGGLEIGIDQAGAGSGIVAEQGWGCEPAPTGNIHGPRIGNVDLIKGLIGWPYGDDFLRNERAIGPPPGEGRWTGRGDVELVGIAVPEGADIGVWNL